MDLFAALLVCAKHKATPWPYEKHQSRPEYPKRKNQNMSNIIAASPTTDKVGGKLLSALEYLQSSPYGRMNVTLLEDMEALEEGLEDYRGEAERIARSLGLVTSEPSPVTHFSPALWELAIDKNPRFN